MSNLQNELESDELEFLEKAFECCDEADSVSQGVIAVEKDSEKYVKKKSTVPPYPNQPCAERIVRREKVSSSWGIHINKEKQSGSMTNEIPALLCFENGESFNEEMIHKLEKALSTISGGSINVLKYSDLQILAKFKGYDAYQEFGKRFMNGEIQKINGFELTEVKVISVMNPLPFYLEVSCSTSDGPKLQADLSSFFVSYCSNFSCIALKETAQKAIYSTSPTDFPQTDEIVPAISMMFMFMAKAQRNAQKFIQAMEIAGKDWEEFSMPKEFCENGEVFLKFSNTPGVSLSVKQGSPFAGIKIMLFVSKKFEEMETFYSFITGKSPLVVDRMEEGIRYRTYSLSRKLELQLVLHPRLKPLHSKNVNLCFSINNIDNILSGFSGDVCNVGESHWQVKDPEGNSVILYSF
ncbi:uncharacterized protein LOC116302031 [Actinia tenebrosa]|uniref:Uncharacterized protein LOC116302031 n=1 Tax=Actinia tenebrosa TaxID=6105 RepID=A0A6P8IJK2_ACTTE|nr:uncharacterized protein LOC116302031 [Actinia tenebrosa]